MKTELRKPKVFFSQQKQKWGIDYEFLHHGRPKRKRLIRYATEEDAEADIGTIESQQAAQQVGAARLTESQTHEALWAFSHLEKLPFERKSLRDAILFYEHYYKEAPQTDPIKKAVNDFLAFKAPNLKAAGYASLKSRLQNMASYFDGKTVGQISSTDLIEFISSKSKGVQGHYRKDCGGFFSHISDPGNDRRILTESPFDGVRFHFRQQNKGKKPQKGVPTTLHLEEVKAALKMALEGFPLPTRPHKDALHFKSRSTKPLGKDFTSDPGDWLAFVVLGCFCGLRPSEIENLAKQENLWQNHVKLAQGKIVIDEKINEKTSDHRLVDMRGNVSKWLAHVKKHSFPIYPNPYKKKWHYPILREHILGERAKNRAFVDVWRHTYCTWLFNDTDKEGRPITLDYVTGQMGHSAIINQKHYRGKLWDNEKAVDFWNLSPKDFKQ